MMKKYLKKHECMVLVETKFSVIQSLRVPKNYIEIYLLFRYLLKYYNLECKLSIYLSQKEYLRVS